MIVWVVGTEDHVTAGDQRLHGYDGDTGAVVYDGGGPNELMAGTHYYSTTGIVARGRIYVAGDNKVYAFAVLLLRRLPQALQLLRHQLLRQHLHLRPVKSNSETYSNTEGASDAGASPTSGALKEKPSVTSD